VVDARREPDFPKEPLGGDADLEFRMEDLEGDRTPPRSSARKTRAAPPRPISRCTVYRSLRAFRTIGSRSRRIGTPRGRPDYL